LDYTAKVGACQRGLALPQRHAIARGVPLCLQIIYAAAPKWHAAQSDSVLYASAVRTNSGKCLGLQQVFTATNIRSVASTPITRAAQKNNQQTLCTSRAQD
jgi:hypothetical protein